MPKNPIPLAAALLVVDMQNDFVEGGSLAVSGGRGLLYVINALTPLFPLVVATKDWHPPGHGSFFTAHPGAEPFQLGNLGGHPQVMWPEHCVAGTPGSDFVAGLDCVRFSRIVTKGKDPGVDSYSTFYDNNHRNPSGLGKFLREEGVQDLFICGLALDYCVRYSAEDALEFVERVHVISDATLPVSPETGEAALQALVKMGIHFVSSRELLEPPPGK